MSKLIVVLSVIAVTLPVSVIAQEQNKAPVVIAHSDPQAGDDELCAYTSCSGSCDGMAGNYVNNHKTNKSVQATVRVFWPGNAPTDKTYRIPAGGRTLMGCGPCSRGKPERFKLLGCEVL